MRCPFCSSEIGADDRFCAFCGRQQPTGKCPQCSKESQPGDTFCMFCGSRLAAAAPVTTAPPAPLVEAPRQAIAADTQATAVPREACAGVGLRFVALLIDSMIIYFVYNFLVTYLGVDPGFGIDVDLVTELGLDGLLREIPKQEIPFRELKELTNLMLLSVISNFVIFLTYYFIMESVIGATFGKLVMGLRVLKKDGRRCTVVAAFIRNLVRVIDSLPMYLIAAVLVLATPYKQRLGDLLAGTVVVKKSRLK